MKQISTNGAHGENDGGFAVGRDVTADGPSVVCQQNSAANERASSPMVARLARHPASTSHHHPAAISQKNLHSFSQLPDGRVVGIAQLHLLPRRWVMHIEPPVAALHYSIHAIVHKGKRLGPYPRLPRGHSVLGSKPCTRRRPATFCAHGPSAPQDDFAILRHGDSAADEHRHLTVKENTYRKSSRCMSWCRLPSGPSAREAAAAAGGVSMTSAIRGRKKSFRKTGTSFLTSAPRETSQSAGRPGQWRCPR